MFEVLRGWRAGGLDRSLAKTEALTLGRLHSLSLGIRHLRAAEPSYWWLSAVFEERWRKSIGLPTLTFEARTPFTTEEELQTVWRWVLDATDRRRLHHPNLDEQLWCLFNDSAVEASMDANLADALRSLPGPITRLRAYFRADDRGGDTGIIVRAEFAGRDRTDREASAFLYNGPDTGDRVETLRSWMIRAAAARSVPCDGPG